MKKLKQFIIENSELPDLYIDMDETLVEWIRGADNALIKQELPIFHDPYWSDFSKSDSDEIRWAAINADIKFWEKLSFSDEGRRLWEYVSRFHPSILTAAHEKSPHCAKEKMNWLRSNIGLNNLREVLVVDRESKKDYATNIFTHRPNILIDDYGKNIVEWRAAGGIGIQFRNAVQAITELKGLGFN
jgi:hypothetical protein